MGSETQIGRRGLGLGLAGLAAALAVPPRAARAADDVLAAVKKSGVLHVGTETQFAPFDFLDNGVATGMNYDLLAEVGKELGVKVVYTDLPWESVLPGLAAARFDMVSGPATITKARSERFRFTPPIADATCALIKRAGDGKITKPADIAGLVVASGKATSQLQQLQQYGATLPIKPTVREYVDFSGAYADLAAGRVEAVGNSLPNIAYVAKQRPDTFALVLPPFGQKAYFGYLTRKDDASASLMDAVGAAIITIKKDGRMAKITQKWFGTTFDLPDHVEPAV
jgi:polar amino acid transport system substrate-binding protein